MMIKIIGTIAIVAGGLLLVLGVMGIFRFLSTGMSPWVFTIFGLLFFFAGISLLKNSKDKDSISADQK